MINRIPHIQILSILSYDHFALRNPLSKCAIRQKSTLGKVGKVVYVELFSFVLEKKFIGVGIELEIVNFRVMANLADNCRGIEIE